MSRSRIYYCSITIGTLTIVNESIEVRHYDSIKWILLLLLIRYFIVLFHNIPFLGVYHGTFIGQFLYHGSRLDLKLSPLSTGKM